MKQVAIGDILTEEQLKEVTRILNEHKADPMSPDCSSALKRYLSQFKDELSKKGVLSDYLAYAIIHLCT